MSRGKTTLNSNYSIPQLFVIRNRENSFFFFLLYTELLIHRVELVLTGAWPRNKRIMPSSDPARLILSTCSVKNLSNCVQNYVLLIFLHFLSFQLSMNPFFYRCSSPYFMQLSILLSHIMDPSSQLHPPVFFFFTHERNNNNHPVLRLYTTMNRPLHSRSFWYFFHPAPCKELLHGLFFMKIRQRMLISSVALFLVAYFNSLIS